METSYQTRTASNEDIPQIITLVKKTLGEYDLAFSSEESEFDLKDIEKTYLENGGIFIVVETQDNEIIGTAALLKIDSATAKLRKMYVDKAYRGMKLGEQLLDQILKIAENRRFETIYLETVHTMNAAISLYRKFGFETIEGEVIISPRCDLMMAKKINRPL